ncbi:HAD hydrolase-like protein [Lacticaseibacillus brantae]|uniref:Phosphatase HAD-superfamily hydrolase n=1 Tax=Lacticaseibacillus brantae DSM 23927 TaxID=1423727 RepID=A0A0R2B8K2_9LACO|nr:HAD hydrolase-like protein [Lacticaseibacillus brantae]KRM72713.1 phosphatase HAD-superfamily hydrolase [Lacticaseibacillus brantae DSM 23927]
MRNAIWDFDGTLYDTYPGMLQALLEVLRAHGVDLNADKTFETIKRGSIRDLLRELAPKTGLTLVDLEAAYHKQEAQYLLDAKPYPQAAAVLETMVAHGNRHFLLTHRDEAAWDMLARDGLKHLFEGGVDRSQDLPRKPDPAAINFLLHRYALRPDETGMIGDRKLDVLAGQAAHVQGIYLNIDGFNDAPTADAIVAQLSDIPALFRH